MVSLGCARNQVDTELMMGRLLGSGWQIIDDPELADVIVVNTCSFIRAAADESIDAILAMAQYKETGNCRRLIVTGCLPERYREDIVSTLPEVDAFLGTGAYDRIAEAVRHQTPGCLLPDPDDTLPQAGDSSRVLTAPHLAYIKIAEGCDRHCTYCIIPKLRGRQKSRPPEAIIAEAASLAARGVRELILVAQETTHYGHDRPEAVGLAELLERLAVTCPDQWIRFLYGHPESITDAVVQTVARHDNLCGYFDLPVQHASTRILRAMGRRYTADDLVRRFESIRRIVPGAALRTTVIVGFPGETDADVDQLADFISRVRFDHLGVFTYSDADDLPSHRLPDPVPAKTATRRLDRLMTLQAAISRENNRRYIGTVLPVLVEEAPEPGLLLGRTMFQAPDVDGLTVLHADFLPPGTVVRARIDDALEYDLIREPA